MTPRIIVFAALLNAGPVEASDRYQVRSGDSLYRIARSHDVPIIELIRVNNLSAPYLRIGQTLIIPQRPAHRPISSGEEDQPTVRDWAVGAPVTDSPTEPELPPIPEDCGCVC